MTRNTACCPLNLLPWGLGHRRHSPLAPPRRPSSPPIHPSLPSTPVPQASATLTQPPGVSAAPELCLRFRVQELLLSKLLRTATLSGRDTMEVVDEFLATFSGDTLLHQTAAVACPSYKMRCITATPGQALMQAWLL